LGRAAPCFARAISIRCLYWTKPRTDCTQQTGSPYLSQNMFDPLQVEIAGIQAVFRFLAVQFYVAGPSDPDTTNPARDNPDYHVLIGAEAARRPAMLGSSVTPTWQRQGATFMYPLSLPVVTAAICRWKRSLRIPQWRERRPPMRHASLCRLPLEVRLHWQLAV
jgi:hypothetical protein